MARRGRDWPNRRQAALELCGAGVAIVLPRQADAASKRSHAVAGLPNSMVRNDGFRRGASLGLFVSQDYRGSKRGLYESLLGEMLDAGVRDVQLIVRWAQDTIRSVSIAPDPAKEEDDETVGWAMDAAHRLGLRVFLMPTVHVRRNAKGSWRGAIAPSDWSAWWRSYRAFIMHYADLAQLHGAELFAVGSELVSTQAHEVRWRALIEDVRGRYRGELTYSANWDRFENVQIWDAVDVAGINAYVPLSRVRDPSESELVQGWHAFKVKVERWSKQGRRRFIFTEIGYASNPFAAIRPYDYSLRGHADLALQLRCYRALFRSWHDVEGLAGLYFWNWFGEGGPRDRDYTPRGKPAFQVIRHWYRGSRAPGDGWRRPR